MAFLINVLAFEGSAQITVLGSSNETVRSIPALCQSINENSVTEVPENGIYMADINGQNWSAVEPCTRRDFVTVFGGTLNGASFPFEAYDSALGNGTGKAAQELADKTRTARKMARPLSKATNTPEQFKALVDFVANIPTLLTATSDEILAICKADTKAKVFVA
jgi:hypothetical protein